MMLGARRSRRLWLGVGLLGIYFQTCIRIFWTSKKITRTVPCRAAPSLSSKPTSPTSPTPPTPTRATRWSSPRRRNDGVLIEDDAFVSRRRFCQNLSFAAFSRVVLTTLFGEHGCESDTPSCRSVIGGCRLSTQTCVPSSSARICWQIQKKKSGVLLRTFLV